MHVSIESGKISFPSNEEAVCSANSTLLAGLLRAFRGWLVPVCGDNPTPPPATIVTVVTSRRVVIGEDQLFVREGIVRLLERAGLDVVGVAASAPELLALVDSTSPDVVVTDIQMPPKFEDDGLRAALSIRDRHPGIGVVVLSQFLDDRYVMELVGDRADGIGYLLKEKVAAPDVIIDAINRVAEGGSALDPDVISALVGRKRVDDPLAVLTPREHDVLELMAEGRSNGGIAEALFVTVPAVERHITGIFTKLQLQEIDSAQHRRVVAVLRYLKETAH